MGRAVVASFKHTLHIVINLNLKHHSHDQAPPSRYTRPRIWYRLVHTSFSLPLTDVGSEVCVSWPGSVHVGMVMQRALWSAKV